VLLVDPEDGPPLCKTRPHRVVECAALGKAVQAGRRRLARRSRELDDARVNLDSADGRVR
jgi:hypothetical protein